jgi:hypothetical protein
VAHLGEADGGDETDVSGPYDSDTILCIHACGDPGSGDADD